MRDIDNYTQCYMEDDFERTMVEIRRRMLLKQLEEFSPKRVLEVGCGMSPVFVHYHPQSLEKMLVVEPGKAFSDNAKRLAEKMNFKDKVVVKRGFLEEMVEAIKSEKVEFDCIIVSSLLHEVEYPKALLAAVRSLCVEKTIVHINVPNAKSLHRLIAMECGMIEDVHDLSKQNIKYQQRMTYDLCTLKKELVECGFKVDGSGSYFIKPFTHAQMQRLISDNIIDERVITGLENISKYFPEYGAEIYVNARLDYNGDTRE